MPNSTKKKLGCGLRNERRRLKGSEVTELKFDWEPGLLGGMETDVEYLHLASDEYFDGIISSNRILEECCR
jgi:hypothetical protein